MPWLAMQRLDRPCEALVGIAWPCAALLCPDQPITIARLCQALRSHAKLCWAVLRPAMHFDAHARAHISCVTLLGQFVGHFCGSLRGAALGPWAFVGHFVGHFCGSHAVLEWVTFARRKTRTMRRLCFSCRTTDAKTYGSGRNRWLPTWDVGGDSVIGVHTLLAVWADPHPRRPRPRFPASGSDPLKHGM